MHSNSLVKSTQSTKLMEFGLQLPESNWYPGEYAIDKTEHMIGYEIQTNASHQKDSLLEAEPRAVNPAGVNIGCSFVTNPKFKSSNYHSQLECMHFHYWSYNVLLTRGCILKSWSTRRWTAPCIRTSNALNSCEIEEYMLHEWSLFYSVSWLKRRIRLLWWSLDFNYSEVIDIRSK